MTEDSPRTIDDALIALRHLWVHSSRLRRSDGHCRHVHALGGGRIAARTDRCRNDSVGPGAAHGRGALDGKPPGGAAER